MTHLNSLLRRTFAVDAVTCVAAGALMAFAAAPMAQITGLPQPLLVGAGIALFPVAAIMTWLSRRQTAPGALLGVVIVGNAAWASGCLAVLFLTTPTLIGAVFLVAQALAVAILTALEYRGAASGRTALTA